MTRIVFLTTTVSPHQLPWCAELAAAHRDIPLWYVYIVKQRKERQALGWNEDLHREDFRVCHIDEEGVRAALESSDVLVADYRDVGLFIRRTEKHLITIYVSERWFKPAAGMLRLLSPRYFLMAWRFARLLKNDNRLYYFPVGVHAARDMVRLCGLMHGDLRCLFRAPEVEFERMPGGRILSRVECAETCRGREEISRVERVETCRGRDGKDCLEKIRMWGYCVEEGRGKREEGRSEGILRVLWVGRLLNLKRVDTIIRAVGELAISSQGIAVSDASTRFYTFCTVKHLHVSTRSTRLNISLDIYGAGPEEARLKKMAAKYGDAIRFHPPVPIAEVRKLMREHDVYVLSSNAHEGWGAVVNEALEEGMRVLGTCEAGASATILPRERLFEAGDAEALAGLLEKEAMGELLSCTIGEWTAKNAAASMEKFLSGAVRC